MAFVFILLAGVMIAASVCRWSIDGCATCADDDDHAYEVFFAGALLTGWITCELIARLFLQIATLVALGVS